MKQERQPEPILPLATIILDRITEGPLSEILPQLNDKLHEDQRRGFPVGSIGIREDIVIEMINSGLLDEKTLEQSADGPVRFHVQIQGLVTRYEAHVMKKKSEEDKLPQFTTYDQKKEEIVY